MSPEFRYVNSQIKLAKDLVAAGKTLEATRAFARASHAIADSFSPAHNDGGQPAVYNPEWNAIEAAVNGHSPLDGVGREGSSALSKEKEDIIVSLTSDLYDSIFWKG